MTKNWTDQDEAREVGDRLAPPTTPDKETIREDRDALQDDHGADREPTEDEEREAEKAGTPSESVSENFEAANERGANVEGEGQITP